MPELKEVFEQVTRNTRPKVDSWIHLEVRQRRAAWNRKIATYSLVTALTVTFAALVLVRWPAAPNKGPVPATPPPNVVPNNTPPLGAQIVALDGTVQGQIPGLAGQPCNPVRGNQCGPERLVSSPDGSTIAFMMNGQVATIGSDGTGLRVLTIGTNTNRGDSQDAVTWSPDGTQIAYSWSGDLYVMNADGSGAKRLTSDPLGDYDPAWSPDGSTIAYWNGSPGGMDGGPNNAEIYTIPATGGRPTRLTNNGVPDYQPTWSPDSSEIAYVSPWHSGIWVVRSDGSNAHLVSSTAGPWSPAWSPDGTRIAVLKYDPSEKSVNDLPLLKVEVLDLATGSVEHLHMRVETDARAPAWLSNNTLLVNRYD